MAVLIEGLSIIVPVQVIEEKYAGGVKAYKNDCPNRTFCSDGVLTRVGFMTPTDARAFGESLMAQGFVFQDENGFVDLAVVDQREGPTAPCSWLDWGSNEKMAGAWLANQEPGKLAVPTGWDYEHSLSKQFQFVANEDVEANLQWLRHERGSDVFLNRETGEEVFVGRTSSESL